MAIILLIAMFPIVAVGIVMGILYHPAFFLLLLLLIFVVPAVMGIMRKA
jgi:hypothetical protein